MKYFNPILATLSILIILVLCQCKKNDPSVPPPILPPETTTGAMTFGCKINGQVFLPDNGGSSPGIMAQYVNRGDIKDGGWHLVFSAFNASSNKGLSFYTDSLFFSETVNYPLKEETGFPDVFYYEGIPSGYIVYHKKDNDKGSIFIKKHDPILKILSGTFSFVATNDSGVKVNITDGRFDIHY